MRTRLVIGAVLIVAAVLGAVVMVGGDPLFVLDPGFFLLVAIAPLGALIAGPGLRVARDALRAAMEPGLRGDAGEGRAGAAVAGFLVAATLAVGCLGAVMDVCWMLKDLTDKDAIAKTLGYGLIPPIYAFVAVAALYSPLRVRATLRALGEEGREQEGGRPAGTSRPAEGWRTAARLFLALLAFLVPAAALHEIFWRSSFALYVDFASFSLVLCVPLGMAIAGPGLSGLGHAVSAIRSAGASLAELRKAKAVMRYMSWAFILAMGLGLLIGLAYLLAEIRNRQRVGPCVALMLISLFWSIVGLTALSLPMEAEAARRLDRHAPPERG